MIFNMPECGGCKTCELACSFYHSGKFSLIMSSMKIKRKKNERGFLVEFIDKKEGSIPPCDGCKKLDEPFCLQYCHKKEILRKMIKEFINNKTDSK